MRTAPDVQIFSPATCAVALGPIKLMGEPASVRCAAPWTEWCRGCNLVYCEAHIMSHPCASRGSLGVGPNCSRVGAGKATAVAFRTVRLK